MILALFLGLFVLLILGVPIFISIALPSMTAIQLFTDTQAIVMAQRFFAGLDKFGIMAMPLFIFAAEVMLRGGIARRLLDWVKTIVSWLPGGTAFAAHFACMFFGAICGSSPATVAAIGGIMYPELLKDKYSEKFSVGLISSSASVAILIPPSVTLIMYGVASGVSIGALFIAGIGAGLVYTLILAIYIYVWVRRQGMKDRVKFNLRIFGRKTLDAIWSIGITLIILGGIYSGVFTATEAAGVSTLYAIIVSMFIYKEMDLKQLYKTAVKAGTTCAQVMVLTAAASAFGWLLTVSQVPQHLASAFLSVTDSPMMFLLFCNIIFLIAGCFMDGSGAVMILTPIMYPLGMQMGINGVLLGVIITTNLAIGMITPPLGLNLFVANGITGVPMTRMIPAIIPFFLVSLVALIIVTYVPAVSMYLPSIVYPGSW